MGLSLKEILRKTKPIQICLDIKLEYISATAFRC